MNGFEIHDKDGNAIIINTLDEQICNLIGNPVHSKNYCYLGKESELLTYRDRSNAGNWFDILGWQIANNLSFQDIIDEYEKTFAEFIGEEDENGLIIDLKTIIPYHIMVLEFWIESGYTGHSVEY